MPRKNAKRIVKNTLILYVRMFFQMAVTLYTSRVIISTLGVEDFGIYAVVGSAVTIFGVLSGNLNAATQRFITFELGKGKVSRIVEVFNTSIIVHLILAIIILLAGESVGLWFLNTHMSIDPSRIYAANWVYQCSLFSFVVSLTAIPYSAAIIAHERMKHLASIGILDVFLKLISVLILPFLSYDKLIVYAIFILIAAVVVTITYASYCYRFLPNCSFRLCFNKNLLFQILSFAGWNFIGASSNILMTQGVNILLNIYFGVVVNAAQGIARQVQNAVGLFIQNFMIALNPQITKSYSGGDHSSMLNLVIQGTRFSFYLIFILSLPLFIETEMILRVWLKVVPQYAVILVRLGLIFTVLQALSNTLITAMLATGDIKKYQMIVGGLQMLNFPLTYLAFELNSPPYAALIIAIVLSCCCLAARLILLKGMIGLPVREYMNNVLLNVSIVSILSMIVPLLLYFNMTFGWMRLIVVSSTAFISTLSIVYVFGLSCDERLLVQEKFSSLKLKYQI